MYTIYLDGQPIWLPGSVDDQYQLLDPVLNLELNNAGELSFVMPPNNVGYKNIKKLKSTITVKRNGKDIWRGRVLDSTRDFWNCKAVTVEGELAFLNDHQQRPFEYRGNIEGYLEMLLNNYNAAVGEDKAIYKGTVTVLDSNDYFYRNKETNESTLALIKTQLIDSYGGYVKLRDGEGGKRYLDYLDTSGDVSDQHIQFGENLLDFDEYINAADVYTVIVPKGKKDDMTGKQVDITSVNNGKDYLASEEGLKLYGWIERTVTWEDVTSPANLLIKAAAELTNAISEATSLTISAVDLSLLDGKQPAFNLGDKIKCISRPHGVEQYFTLSKMGIPLDNPGGETYTLGTIVTSLTHSTNNAYKMLEDETSAALIQARINATNLINGNGKNGHVVLHADPDTGVIYEILILDTTSIESAQNVWRWNSGGFGFSKNGYNGPYETAITMDGAIVASFITSGVMSADRIKGGTFEVGGSGAGKDGVVIGKDANNNVIFQLDKNGGTFRGDISAASLGGGAGQTLQSALNTANQAIQTAQQAAQTAQQAANSAQSTASLAQNTASTAQTVADTANNAATTANSAAETAKKAASTAQTVANTAKKTADGAATQINNLVSGAITANHIKTTAATIAGGLYFRGRAVTTYTDINKRTFLILGGEVN